MFKRQTSGAVVCTSCGQLVAVNDATCYNCGRRNPGLWGYAPALRSLGHDLGFVTFVTGTCAVVYVLTLLFSRGQISMNFPFGLLGPSRMALVAFGASGYGPVIDADRWWTVLSAGWLHGGLLHILINMYWIRQLAVPVADLYGPGRMIIVYTVGSVAGFIVSSTAVPLFGFMPILGGGYLTVGASAAMFGLLGALVYYGRRTGSSYVYRQALSLAGIMFMFGIFMDGIDNWAHAGGFAGGYLAGQLLDPLKPERIDHLLMAVVCLVVSVLSVIVSVLHWWWLGGFSLG